MALKPLTGFIDLERRLGGSLSQKVAGTFWSKRPVMKVPPGGLFFPTHSSYTQAEMSLGGSWGGIVGGGHRPPRRRLQLAPSSGDHSLSGPAAPPARLILGVVDGKRVEKIEIGRETHFPDNAVISRRHCIIEWIDGGWVLRDESRNGTALFHQGTRQYLRRGVQEPIHHGDKVVLADSVSFVFWAPESERAPSHFERNLLLLTVEGRTYRLFRGPPVGSGRGKLLDQGYVYFDRLDVSGDQLVLTGHVSIWWSQQKSPGETFTASMPLGQAQAFQIIDEQGALNRTDLLDIEPFDPLVDPFMTMMPPQPPAETFLKEPQQGEGPAPAGPSPHWRYEIEALHAQVVLVSPPSQDEVSQQLGTGRPYISQPGRRIPISWEEGSRLLLTTDPSLLPSGETEPPMVLLQYEVSQRAYRVIRYHGDVKFGSKSNPEVRFDAERLVGNLLDWRDNTVFVGGIRLSFAVQAGKGMLEVD